MANQPHSGQTSRLLSLPPEIRNIIYREVLDHRHQKWYIRIATRLPGLLHTCQQLRAEATQIYFSETLFRLTFTTQEFKFLHSLPPDYRRAMRYLMKIRLPISPENCARSFHKAFMALQRNGLHGHIKSGALKVFAFVDHEIRIYSVDGSFCTFLNLVGKKCTCDHTGPYAYEN